MLLIPGIRLAPKWILPVAAGMLVFGLILGSVYSEAMAPLLGVSALLGCLGIGFLFAARIAGRWYPAGRDSENHQLKG